MRKIGREKVEALDCSMDQLSSGIVEVQLPRDDLCECNRAGWELREKMVSCSKSYASERYNVASAVKYELSGMRHKANGYVD